MRRHRIVMIMPLKTKEINKATICTSKDGFVFKTPSILVESITDLMIAENDQLLKEKYRAVFRRVRNHINGIEPIE